MCANQITKIIEVYNNALASKHQGELHHPLYSVPNAQVSGTSKLTNSCKSFGIFFSDFAFEGGGAASSG